MPAASRKVEPVRLLRTKPWFRGEYLSVRSAPNGLRKNRWAVLVSKSAVRLASDRHRIKRAVLGRARGIPNMGQDFLVAVLKGKASKKELDSEFSRIRIKIDK